MYRARKEGNILLPFLFVYLLKCGVLQRRLFDLGSYHNLLTDKRNQLHTFFLYLPTVLELSGEKLFTMKRWFVWTLLGVFVSEVGIAQLDGGEKDLRKLARKRAKILLFDGWKVDGERSLEEVMYVHLQRLQSGENQELVAHVMAYTSVIELGQAQEWAVNKASGAYAKQAMRAFEEGMAETSSVNCFYGGYEGKVRKEIGGLLKMSVGLYRERVQGGIDYKIFYIVNEADALGARVCAMEQAMEKSEYVRQNAERIFEVVRKRFVLEVE